MVNELLAARTRELPPLASIPPRSEIVIATATIISEMMTLRR